MVLNFCATTISLALTHERTPHVDPLPDFLLDNVQNRVWGLTASEIVLQVIMQGTQNRWQTCKSLTMIYIEIMQILFFITTDKRYICNDCANHA